MINPIIQTLRQTGPAHIAFDDSKARLSADDVLRFTEQEARWLARTNAQRFALFADNGCGWVLSDLALLTLDALNVPVPPSFTAAQVRHVLDDAAIECILTDRSERVLDQHPEFAPAGMSNRTGLALLRRRTAPTLRHTLPPRTTKITYTSGSTAAPKGVCLSTQAIMQVARSLSEATRSLDIRRHLSLLPFATLLENIAGIYVPLLLRATSVVPSTETTGMSYGALNIPQMLRCLQREQPESLVLVPELLRVLLAAIGRGWQAPANLRFIAIGGAAVSPELIRQAHASGLPAYEGYGLSECASVVCLNTPAASRSGSVGRPLPHAQVRIDAAGHIRVRGAAMSGYLGMAGGENKGGVEPHETDPLETDTGDLGEIDADGFVYVRGRAKNMFITSMGRNVSPEWVESELTRHPVISQAMVVGEARPHAVALLALAASPANAAVADRAAIDRAVAAANARLPDYARVRNWAPLPEAPTPHNGLATANGRLKRDAIAARYGALIDSLYTAMPVANFYSPSNETDHALS